MAVWHSFDLCSNFLPDQSTFKCSQAKREDICLKWIFSEFEWFFWRFSADLTFGGRKVKPHDDGSGLNKEDQTRPTFQVIKQCWGKKKQCAMKTMQNAWVQKTWWIGLVYGFSRTMYANYCNCVCFPMTTCYFCPYAHFCSNPIPALWTQRKCLLP